MSENLQPREEKAKGTESPSEEKLKAATEVQWKLYSTINESICFADTKAAAVLVASGVLMAVTAIALKDQGSFLLSHRIVQYLAGLGGIALLFATVLSLFCLVPRVSRHGSVRPPNFVGDIAREETAKSYAGKAMRLAEPQIAFDQVCERVWIDAHVAARKDDLVRYAVLCLGLALILGLEAGVCSALILRPPDSGSRAGGQRARAPEAERPTASVPSPVRTAIKPSGMPAPSTTQFQILRDAAVYNALLHPASLRVVQTHLTDWVADRDAGRKIVLGTVQSFRRALAVAPARKDIAAARRQLNDVQGQMSRLETLEREAYARRGLQTAILAKLRPDDRKSLVDAMRLVESRDSRLSASHASRVAESPPSMDGLVKEVREFHAEVLNSALPRQELARDMIAKNRRALVTLRREEASARRPTGPRRGSGKRAGRRGHTRPASGRSGKRAGRQSHAIPASGRSRAPKGTISGSDADDPTSYDDIGLYCMVTVSSWDRSHKECPGYAVSYEPKFWEGDRDHVQEFRQYTRASQSIAAGRYVFWCTETIGGTGKTQGSQRTLEINQKRCSVPLTVPGSR
jgi:hypothetical protein